MIVGCGYTGMEIVARLRRRFRIYGVVSGAASAAAVRAAGAIPLCVDLDQTGLPLRLRALAKRVLVLVPTSAQGRRDQRSAHVLGALRQGSAGHLIYLSTTGVYGDRGGAWTDETVPAAPANDRAHRRLHAERQWRSSAWHGSVLRVPGIYGPGRLPAARLSAGLPVAEPAEDVYTNHIHVVDLARACIAALFLATPARVYNIVDDSSLKLGDYLDRVADALHLQRPPRAAWDTVRQAAGPQRMSFLSESRRLSNMRMKSELRLRLRYPNIDAGLADLAAARASPAQTVVLR